MHNAEFETLNCNLKASSVLLYYTLSRFKITLSFECFNTVWDMPTTLNYVLQLLKDSSNFVVQNKRMENVKLYFHKD